MNPAVHPDLTRLRALWVAPETVAVPVTMVPANASAETATWWLAWSPSGALDVTRAEPSRARLAFAGPVDPALVRAHPELAGYLAVRLDPATVARVPQILTAQAAISSYGPDGALADACGVQLALVLDVLYARTAAVGAYGPRVHDGAVTYRVWAPTAQDVRLLTWPASSPPDLPVGSATRTPMARQEDGSWTATTGRPGDRYLYDVTVFVPATGRVERNLVTDPCSTGLTLNSTRSVAVDLRDPAYMPAVWTVTPSPPLARAVDSSIYELHVRDFSIGDPSIPSTHRGTYLAFADSGEGAAHLRALAEAGLNTVHLLPTFDIATLEEDRSKQATPQHAGCPDLTVLPPDSAQQQACLTAIGPRDGFNWGYDPYHWGVPEGSYASTPTAADGGTRVEEFRTMVGALHRMGLRVVLDQVFNHTTTSGQEPTSVLDRIVPGYYYRLDPLGKVYASTCCPNIATEHVMAEKIMVDTVVRWARDYKVDGFRFDLMGFHTKANMIAVRAALDALTMEADGVDGRSMYVYGEGWNFGEVADGALFTQACQGNLGGTGIGTFSDRLRDAVRGGGVDDGKPRVQGFGSGAFTDPNGDAVNADAEATLARDTDLVMLGLAGGLRTFTFTSTSGSAVRGDAVDYGGHPAAYADEPDEVVTYVDAHDNETLWDALTYKLPVATSMADRIRMNTLALATTALAQTPSFWHAGADLLRSKSFDRNSYDSGDWFNTLSWSGSDNGFGHGLPLYAENGSTWPVLQPLLANVALKPTAEEVQHASALARDLLRLRYSTPLFRLGSAELVNAKVSFPVSGTADAHPGVIVLRVDDTVGPDIDPHLRGLLVVLNATPSTVEQHVPGLAGVDLRLSPVQAAGADEVVRASAWAPGTATLTVPARTAAVFVH